MNSTFNRFARLRDSQTHGRVRRNSGGTKSFDVAPDIGTRQSDYRQLLATNSETSSLANESVDTLHVEPSIVSSSIVVTNSTQHNIHHDDAGSDAGSGELTPVPTRIPVSTIDDDQLLRQYNLSLASDKVTIVGLPVDIWKAIKVAISRPQEHQLSDLLFGDHKIHNLSDKDGYRPIHWAAYQGHTPSVFRLIACGSKLNIRTDTGWTPLHWASYYNHVAIVRLLLDYGAIVDVPTQNGCTSLHWASQRGHLDTVKLLIGYGANIQAETITGTTPLHSASRNGQESVVRFLLEQGADINRKADNGSTPLHAAAQSGYGIIVRLLVEHGARVNDRSVNKKTPLKICGSKDVKLYLKSVEATK